MTRIDQFESVFKAASKERFEWKPVELSKVLLVADVARDEADRIEAAVRARFPALDVEWTRFGTADHHTVGELLHAVSSAAPDLVCTWRNLHSSARDWPYSLGSQLDVLAQETSVPVLVVPRPEEETFWASQPDDDRFVMGMTDHLTGDAGLVRWAATMAAPGGTLCLSHVEDERTFDRYLEAIGKIPEIDTDTAADRLRQRLLAEPSDYVDTCAEALAEIWQDVTVEKLVTFGRRLVEVKRLVTERRADLLVLPTKDQDQMAMHGLAYPMAVELRSFPLLML